MAEKKKLLLADDDPEWRRLLPFWLEKAGYSVRVVENGQSVLPAALKDPPDCFILDHDMGDMTGHQVVKELKSRPEFKATPVIMLTSHSEMMLKMVTDTPPDQFVVKSAAGDELLLTLSMIFPDAPPA